MKAGTVLLVAAVAAGVAAYGARATAATDADDDDPEYDYPLDPDDPEDPPPIPGLPTPDPGAVCTAPLASAAAETILAQLPEPYRCQARTTIASDPYWRTNLETAALGAQSIGLDAIAALLSQLASVDLDPSEQCPAPRAAPAQEQILAQLPEPYRCQARTMIASDPRWQTNLETLALGAESLGRADLAALIRALAGGAAPVPAWPTTYDPTCPGVPTQQPAVEDMLAQLPDAYRCDARRMIAESPNPASWARLLAQFSLGIRMIDPVSAATLAQLAAFGATQ